VRCRPPPGWDKNSEETMKKYAVIGATSLRICYGGNAAHVRMAAA
jgi:hypothetical protein